MSTRAHVKIIEKPDTLMCYRHCDGYPEGTGPDLVSAVKKNGFDDVEYLAATIIRTDSNSNHPTFAPAVSVHGDEEYFWFVDCDNKEIRYSHSIDGKQTVYYKG